MISAYYSSQAQRIPIRIINQFISHCANILRPLYALIATTKAKQLLDWNNNTLKAFHYIKQAIENASLLSYPKLDAPNNIVTDTSNTAALFFKNTQIIKD